MTEDECDRLLIAAEAYRYAGEKLDTVAAIASKSLEKLAALLDRVQMEVDTEFEVLSIQYDDGWDILRHSRVSQSESGTDKR